MIAGGIPGKTPARSASLAADHRDILLSFRLLRGLTGAQIDGLAAFWEERRYAPGDCLLREGEPDRFVYLLVDGRVELWKSTSLGTRSSPIGELRAGDTFGEVKIVDRQPSSASVIAATPVTAVAIDLSAFDRGELPADTRATVWRNVGQILAERLRRTSVTGADAIRRELAESEARVYAGRFLLFVFCIIAVPQLAFAAVDLIPAARQLPQPVMSFAFIAWTIVPVWLALRHSPFPRESYGLTLRGGWAHLWTALAWTAPILVLLVVVKLICIHGIPSMIGRPLFDPWAGFGGPSLDGRLIALSLLLETINAPFSEFVGRAVLLGSLQQFLGVPAGRVHWRAIAMASLLLASGLGFRGFWFSAAAFAFGLFWGWMFARQGSLVGVCASHIAVVWWGLFALGWDPVLDAD